MNPATGAGDRHRDREMVAVSDGTPKLPGTKEYLWLLVYLWIWELVAGNNRVDQRKFNLKWRWLVVGLDVFVLIEIVNRELEMGKETGKEMGREMESSWDIFTNLNTRWYELDFNNNKEEVCRIFLNQDRRFGPVLADLLSRWNKYNICEFEHFVLQSRSSNRSKVRTFNSSS